MNSAAALGNGTNATRWSLRLFGGFELSVLSGGERVTTLGKRERLLLAYLALSANLRQPRRKLAALLWGDATDETLLDNLRASVFKLRKALGDSEHRVVASDGEDIVLDAAAFEVDVLVFRRLAVQSGRSDLEAAANLSSREFLDGLDIDSEEFESWRRAEASRCREQTVDVLIRLIAQLSESGETERAIKTGEQLLRLEPLHEVAVRRLMRLHAGGGRRSAAIQLYRTLSDALKADLGVQPEAETRALFEEISRGEEIPALASLRPSSPPPLSWPATLVPAKAGSGHPGDEVLIQRRVARRNWILAGGLAATVMTAFFLYEFATTTVQQQTAVDVAKAVSSSPTSAISIAVLPFANLSGDPEQEFFSDGITEEITTALAKVPGLRVVGRTSAYQFKDEKRDLRAIGQALAATRLIEGSVRKTGDRLRISVQLVNANDGTQLWSENYDRLLTDIFVVQDDIARSIATSLRVPLGLAADQQLVANRTIDSDSYQQYLRARALNAQRGPGVGSAIEILEPLVARNSNYAPAWAELALAYSLAPIYHPARYGSSIEASRRAVDELLGKADAAAQRAVQLDPGAVAYAPLGYLQFVRGKLLLAEDRYRQALALDPNGPLQGLALLLAEVGRLNEALALSQQLHELEPFVPLFNGSRGTWLWADGQTDAAIAILKGLPNNSGSGGLAMIYASLGRYAEAADLLESFPGQGGGRAFLKDAARLLRTAPATPAAPQSLPNLGALGWVYLHVGAPERALENYERDVQNGFSGSILLPVVWHSSFAPVRKTERFKAYARSSGLVEYWRVKGWPQWCHPTTGEDFACD